MKKDIKKSMMPATVAPVQRETAATASRCCEVNAIAASHATEDVYRGVEGYTLGWDPFAGDDAE